MKPGFCFFIPSGAYLTVFNRPLLETSAAQTISLVTAELDYKQLDRFLTADGWEADLHNPEMCG
jgi:hypothetical protein